MARIELALEDGVAQVALDDGKVNAMSVPWFRELGEVLDRVEKERPRAVVFSGRPGIFSAGLDVKMLPTLSTAEMKELADVFARTMLRVWSLPLPTVAACTGHAVAGGALLAFGCDRRVALDGPYRVQMNETRIGLALPIWAVTICRSVLPNERWTEALLLARPYTPPEAFELGLWTTLVPEGGDLAAAVRRATADFDGIDRRAYAVTKRRLREPEAERALALQAEELAAAG